MIAVRILGRPQWEAILREHGCEPCAEGEARKIQTAEWWKTRHNKLFTVPISFDNETLSQTDVDYLLIEIAKLKPLDWDR